LLGFAVGLLSLMLALGIEQRGGRHDVENAKTRALGQVTDYANAVKVAVNRALSASYALSALVQQGAGHIAKMVLALAESLRLAVIAEGGQVQAQADSLAHQGCRAYQGYVFSRPQPQDALEAFMRCG
jgi:hypothetical protein